MFALVEYLEDPYLDFDEDEIRDRKKIFKEIMDNDGDGKVDRRELIAYLGNYYFNHLLPEKKGGKGEG